jgi:predicted nucleic acid-binding Zn ribbon protein
MSSDLKKLQEKLEELTKDTKNLDIPKIQHILERIEKIKAYNKAYTKKYYENVRKNKLKQERLKNKVEVKKVCAICGKEFVAESHKNKYCSEECRIVGTRIKNRERNHSEKGLQYQQKYRQTESYKESQKRYRTSKKGKATFMKYYEKYKANGYKALHKPESIEIK